MPSPLPLTTRCEFGTWKAGPASPPSRARDRCCVALLRQMGAQSSPETNRAEDIFSGWKIWTKTLISSSIVGRQDYVLTPSPSPRKYVQKPYLRVFCPRFDTTSIGLDRW